MGYLSAVDALNPKFTGKNRDNETALDWFEIRAMSSAQGRFQSVDPANAGASLGNPQTWNAYSYVGNNPLSNTDPSGEGILAILGGIVGTFFGGPMGAIIGFSAGTAGEAALWGPSSNIGAGLPGVGSFTGCGGPLGNCRGFGNEPWSEDSGLASVKDPGRFILEIQRQRDSTFDQLTDLIAGSGDDITFGITRWIRKTTGGEDAVNPCSNSYAAGRWIGTTLSLATGVSGGIKAAGAKATGLEFSHWIPKRFNGPRSLLNGNFVTPARHYLHDPYRFPRGWRDLGPKFNPIVQQLDRIPNVFKGTAIGAAYGAVSAALAAPNCRGN